MESERELERTIDDFMTRGYKVIQRGQYSAKVKEKDWGSAPIHGFVFIFAFIGSAVLLDAAGASAAGVWVVTILANIVYAAYSRFTAEQYLIKFAEGDQSE